MKTLKNIQTLIIGSLALFAIILVCKPVQANPSETVHKILFVVSSDEHGYWLPEVLEPYQVVTAAGYEVDIASPKGKSGTARGTFQLSRKQRDWFAQSHLKTRLNNSIALADITSTHYSAIYFAGGAGPMFDFHNNKVLQNLTREIYEQGGLVAADCHGPAALINVTLSDGTRLVRGKKITAKANHEEGNWARNNYPFLLEDKFKSIGAIYSSVAKGQPHVVVDQRIITGQNPASAMPMAKALVQKLANL